MDINARRLALRMVSQQAEMGAGLAERQWTDAERTGLFHVADDLREAGLVCDTPSCRSGRGELVTDAGVFFYARYHGGAKLRFRAHDGTTHDAGGDGEAVRLVRRFGGFDNAAPGGTAPVDRGASRYDSGFGTIDYTCDECGQKVKSRTLPQGWADEGGNRHRCPDHQDWPYQLACETCPATVGYDDGTFESRVMDQGWTPENDVTGGVLCPDCAAKWLDADGLLKPGAPVKVTAAIARRIARLAENTYAPPSRGTSAGPAVRQRDELSRKMEFPLIPDFVWTGEDLNPWRCGCCATAPQRRRAERMEDAELEPPRCCRKCGVSF